MTLGKRPGYIKYGDDAGIMQRFDAMWKNASILGQWRLTTYLTHLKDIWCGILLKKYLSTLSLNCSKVSAAAKSSVSSTSHLRSK